MSMEVYDAPEYSLEFRIDSDGNVNIPMVGSVHVADLTLVEASQKSQLRCAMARYSTTLRLTLISKSMPVGKSLFWEKCTRQGA